MTVALLIHANQDVVESVQQALLGVVNELLVATTGPDGLSAANQQAPSLILTDVMLPLLDGITLMKALRSQPATRHIPVIYLSEKQDVSTMMQGLAVGARYFITIPFDPEDLVSKVNKLLV